MTKVLIVGSDGRAAAMKWKLEQSYHVSHVYAAPGNGGTHGGFGGNVDIDATKRENFPALAEFVHSHGIDYVVVSPEGPLAAGITDELGKAGIRVFGPTKTATDIEASKFFSYNVMRMCGIPQARSVLCHTKETAERVLRTWEGDGVVLKADGLTGGKGVGVYETKEQALEDLARHAQAYGERIIVAERLYGDEFSVFGISDGNRVVPFEVAVQDYKRQRDDDQGPNTGGMGSHTVNLDTVLLRSIADTIMTPAVRKMKQLGREYRGFLYVGMMQTKEGSKVLEFNARLGDPETQSLMPKLKTDLFTIVQKAYEGKLDDVRMEYHPGEVCTVVLASPGYPGKVETGHPISGLEHASRMENVQVFHAGTKLKDGQVVTSGGRVLGVAAYAEHGLAAARYLAYQAAAKISIPGGFQYREDIARVA